MDRQRMDEIGKGERVDEEGEGIEGGKCEADLQLMTAYMCALSRPVVFRLFAFTLAFVPYSVDRVT